MKALSIALIFCLALFGANAAHYAVLVAGSNMFYNYRHQADVYHAYQTLIKNGFEKDNIVTFAYDDIATDPQNPFPGKVFNKPTDGEGEDVYAGITIDYKGKDVTPDNFLAVLKGSDILKKQGKKILESTEEDNVFIFFSDHGASGLIAFPYEYLYANNFMSTLTWMSQNKKYKQMVIYIEACESGSMFQGILPQNISIYATTAANSEESSWGTYCSPNDKVNGKSIGSCLGDLYSVNVWENIDAVDPSQETLITQFGILVQKTNLSHVQRFGDVSISNQIIGNFEANQASYKGPVKLQYEEEVKENTHVDSRYNKLYYLQNKHKNLQSSASASELAEEMASIAKYDSTFSKIAREFNLNTDVKVRDIDFACLKQRVALYEELCGKFSDYGLKYVKHIHYTCSQGVDLVDFELSLLNKCL
jgi:legumain